MGRTGQIALIIVAVVVVGVTAFYRMRPGTAQPPPPTAPAAPAATETPAAAGEAAVATPAPAAVETATAIPAAESPLTVAGQPESPLAAAGPFESPLLPPGFSVAPPEAWPRGAVLFHSNASGQFEILKMVDGVGPVSLTRGLGDAVEPALSPDGTRVAFGLYNNDKSQMAIYVMNVDGSDARRLVEDQPLLNWRPTWSPDGQQILFVSNRDGVFEIYRVNADGTGLVNLSNSPESHDHDPDWSPDGSQIVFVSDRDFGRRGVYLMNADGSDVRQIPGPVCFCSYPRWSPDGTRIAYASQHDVTWDIFVMNPDGSESRQVTQREPDNYIAEWVSDEQMIFGGDEVGATGIDLFLVNVDGTSEVQLNTSLYSEESFPTLNP